MSGNWRRWLLALSAIMSGAAAAELPSYPMAWDPEAAPWVELAPEDPARPLPPTRFRAFADEAGFEFQMEFEEPEPVSPDGPKNQLEIFFQNLPGRKIYYQAYGELPGAAPFAGFFGGEPNGRDATRADLTGGELRAVGDGHYRLRCRFGWEDFLWTLPFAEGEGVRKWPLAVCRFRRFPGEKYPGTAAHWGGQAHRVETFGTLNWAEPSREQLLAIYRHCRKRCLETMAPYDPTLYTRESYEAEQARRRAAAAAPAPTTPEALAAELRILREGRVLRRILAVNPGGETDAAGGLRYRWSAAAEVPNLWLTNLAAAPGTGVRIVRNGQTVRELAATALPANVALGAVRPGEVVTVEFAPVSGAKVKGHVAVEALWPGIEPAAPTDPVREYRTTEAEPKFGRGGWISEAFLRGHRQLCQAQLRDAPEVVFLGDSLTQGFVHEGRTWSRLAPLRALNFGIAGDRIQHNLWRVEHGVFEQRPPKLVVVEIGTNNARNSAAELIEGTQALIAELRRRTPGSKILLLSLFPTRGRLPLAAATNAGLARCADNRNVFFLDLTSVWLNPDGTLREELRSADGCHILPVGYERWMEAMLPTIRKLVGEEP